jgi:hypothetical protein
MNIFAIFIRYKATFGVARVFTVSSDIAVVACLALEIKAAVYI